jgi:hypothetical protein
MPNVARIPLRAASPTIFRSGAWGSLRIASGRWSLALGAFQDEGAAVSEMGGNGVGAHAKERRREGMVGRLRERRGEEVGLSLGV